MFERASVQSSKSNVVDPDMRPWHMASVVVSTLAVSIAGCRCLSVVSRVPRVYETAERVLRALRI